MRMCICMWMCICMCICAHPTIALPGYTSIHNADADFDVLLIKNFAIKLERIFPTWQLTIKNSRDHIHEIWQYKLIHTKELKVCEFCSIWKEISDDETDRNIDSSPATMEETRGSFH